MKIELKILDPRISIPAYATPGAAAVDLRSTDFDGIIEPGRRVLIGTGIAIHVGSAYKGMSFDKPIRDEVNHYAGLILPRSGLGSRGITIGNSPGLIDEDYTGEIKLAIWNASDSPFEVNALDRLAQLVIVPILRAEYVPVTEFSEVTKRGDGGFGSTGK